MSQPQRHTPIDPAGSFMEVLKTLRQRPGLYLCDYSGNNLENLIAGWNLCLDRQGLCDPDLELLLGWMNARHSRHEAGHPLRAKVKELGDEASLDWFFAEYDRYVAL